MPAPTYLCKTDRAGLVSLTAGDEVVLQRADAFREALTKRCGRDVANLFASPIPSPDGGNISWYAEASGELQPLAAMDPEKRRAPEARLRDRLAKLAPVLADAELGPALAAALHVASANDIVVVGDQPLLINWSLVPANAAGSKAALARHFSTTLGPYAPFPAPALSRVAAPEPVAVVAPKTDETTADLVPRPQAPLPWHEFRYQLIAIAAAAAFLLYLVLPDVLYAWYGTSFSDAVQRARELNGLLATKIAEVEKGLAAAVCGPSGLTVPGGQAALPQGDPAQVKPPPVATPPGMKPPANYLDYLDNAVVLVIPDRKDAVSFGSGFFIGPKTIVTNNHVIHDVTRAFVINRGLGKLTPVTVRAHTPGTAPHADFAVLELAPDGPSGPTMPISTQAERLQDVVVAGFPGINVESDSKLMQLLQGGDATAIPELVASPGAIMQTLKDENPPVIAVNTPINHGNSGGPLVDYCGRALGLNTYGQEHDGDKAYYALAVAGLIGFLDANQITYTRADEPCNPQTASAAPSGNTQMPKPVTTQPGHPSSEPIPSAPRSGQQAPSLQGPSLQGPSQQGPQAPDAGMSGSKR